MRTRIFRGKRSRPEPMWRFRLRLRLTRFRRRCAAALEAFRGATGYVVIYDLPGEGGDHERYYGFFADEREALDIFNDAFPEGTAHSVSLCRVVKEIRPYDERLANQDEGEIALNTLMLGEIG